MKIVRIVCSADHNQIHQQQSKCQSARTQSPDLTEVEARFQTDLFGFRCPYAALSKKIAGTLASARVRSPRHRSPTCGIFPACAVASHFIADRVCVARRQNLLTAQRLISNGRSENLRRIRFHRMFGSRFRPWVAFDSQMNSNLLRRELTAQPGAVP